MTCRDVLPLLPDLQRGRLDPDGEQAVRAHLAGCRACSSAADAESELAGLLESRLPYYPAPIALKRSLSALWPDPAEARRSWRDRWGRRWAPAAAVVLALLLAAPLYYERLVNRRGAAANAVVAEAVNDHLRILQGGRPLDVESGDLHRVKPWFEGRLDFAPVVPFLGDEEFPLRGGALAYFLDRKAAAFVYGYRLHAISVFVFPAEGLPWPGGAREPPGSARASERTDRGFRVFLWRSGGLGYAVVSDADPAVLRKLAVKLSGGA